MHLSISTKVTVACAAVLMPSLLLLASWLNIGAEVGAANGHIGHLTELLRGQNRYVGSINQAQHLIEAAFR